MIEIKSFSLCIKAHSNLFFDLSIILFLISWFMQSKAVQSMDFRIGLYDPFVLPASDTKFGLHLYL